MSPKITKKHSFKFDEDQDTSVSSNTVMQAKSVKFHTKKIVFTHEKP